MARLRLQNMMFYGYHGVSKAERETGRRFEVDCEMDVDISSAAATDRLEETVNYTAVYDLIEHIVEERKFNLLESVAVRIADDIIDQFGVGRVIIRVRKRIPPIPGNLDYIEVEYDSASAGDPAAA